MVFKRYLHRNGKVFGPYYYRNYRNGTHVRQVYIGGEKGYKEWKRKSQGKSKTTIEQFDNKPFKIVKPYQMDFVPFNYHNCYNFYCSQNI